MSIYSVFYGIFHLSLSYFERVGKKLKISANLKKSKKMAGILVNEIEKIKITETKATNRHCAYCLIPILAHNVQICGKCHRRAYCSDKCQASDWTVGGSGQGHKNWCELNCGEEDLDWKVVQIPGKGLGVVALRPLPAKYRIMVEARHLTPTSHPRIQDLLPCFTSLHNKFYYNAVGSDDRDEVDAVCLRLSRVNHSCDPNASHSDNYSLGEHKVKVLFAERDIAAGEEICFAYFVCFKSVGIKINAEDCRTIFNYKWRFDCPGNCICRNKKFAAVVERARDLDTKISLLARAGQFDEALEGVNQLMELHSVIKSSFSEKKATLMMGWETSFFTTPEQARSYLKQLADLMTPFYHPLTENTLGRKLLAIQEKQ